MRDLADLHDRLRKAFGPSVPTGPEASAREPVQPADVPPGARRADGSVLSNLLGRLAALTTPETETSRTDAGRAATPVVSDALQVFLDSNDLLSVAAVARTLGGIVVAANATFRFISGSSSPAGRTLEEIGLPLPCEMVEARDVELAAGDGMRVFAWQDVAAPPHFGSDRLILSVARDVTTDRRLAHESEDARLQAEEASGVKSRQLATIVHELRTPLNGILGMSQLLQQTGLTLEQKNYVGGIRQAGLALAQLVDDLLDYSTIEAGRFRLNSRAENLRQLLESVVEMLAPRAHEKDIEIGATVSFDVPNLMDFDPARLRQVLFNVIGNAVKFTQAGGVLIGVGLEDGEIVITVTDTGPGMTADEQQRVFGEFEQAGTAAERSGGTGLGLSISARILKEFGGSLSATSEKGRGTTFAIRFPALSADAAMEGRDRMLLLRSSRVLLLAPAGSAAAATISTIETLGGRCRHVRTTQEAERAIGILARQGLAFTDMIVDHRIPDIDRIGPAAHGLRRILLVSPEERGTQPWDAYDAWLIRPLREQSLVDVLRGRLGGVGSQWPSDYREIAPAPAPARPSPEQRGPAISVLLAEDDPVSALMVGAILRKAGCIVHHVPDMAGLRQALKQASPPDIVISDVHMPDGNLADLLPLYANEPGEPSRLLPLLVLSGETDRGQMARLLDAGARRVLHKPLDPQQLLEEIAAILPASPHRRRVS